MLITVAVLVGTSFVPGQRAQVWVVTAPAGLTALMYNVVNDLLHPEIGQEIVRQQSRDSAPETAVADRTAPRSDPATVQTAPAKETVGDSSTDLEKRALALPELSMASVQVASITGN